MIAILDFSFGLVAELVVVAELVEAWILDGFHPLDTAHPHSEYHA